MYDPIVHRNGLALAGAAVLIVTSIGAAHAHSSVDEVLGDIQSRERYLEAVDRTPPPFALWDAEGRRVALADFTGKVVVLNFIYARCREFCPLQSALLAKVQGMLREANLVEGVQFVSIATDAEEADATAGLMRGYATLHGLDPANWMFLYRGAEPADTTVRLAERYGLKFTQGPDGDQMHGVVTHVIDREGRMRARFHGLRFAPENLLFFVAALMNDAPGHADAAEVEQEPAASSASAFTNGLWLAVALVVAGLVATLLVARMRHRRRAQS